VSVLPLRRDQVSHPYKTKGKIIVYNNNNNNNNNNKNNNNMVTAQNLHLAINFVVITNET
jgi:hypothetical protein